MNDNSPPHAPGTAKVSRAKDASAAGQTQTQKTAPVDHAAKTDAAVTPMTTAKTDKAVAPTPKI